MKHFCLALLSFWSIPVFSQSNVVASGGNESGSGGSISYSVGQIDYVSVSGTGGALSQGNQQAFEIYENALDEQLGIKLSAFVYPNPTNNFVLLKTDGTELAQMTYKVFDSQGKEVQKSEISMPESKISFSSAASGTYFLRIYKNSTEIKSFKIIKNL